jgi:hypothetical protein
MKARLIEAKGRDVIPLNALAENWYFLRSAIETVFKNGHPSKEALPYRIFTEYQKRSESHSVSDSWLAKKEVLASPAYVKERHRTGLK